MSLTAQQQLERDAGRESGVRAEPALPPHDPLQQAILRESAYVTAREAARLEACSERSMRQGVNAGRYEARPTNRRHRNGAPVLEVAVASLSPRAQAAYLQSIDSAVTVQASEPKPSLRFDSSTDAEKLRALERLRAVKALRRLRASGPTDLTKAIAGFAKTVDYKGERGVSSATLRRWEKQFEEFGLDGLVVTYEKRSGPRSLTDEMVAFIHAVRVKHPRLNSREIHKTLVAECARRGWLTDGERPPSYSSVRRECRRAETLAAYGEGPRTFRDLLPHVERDWGCAPNTVWCADSRLADTLVMLDNGKAVRPWLVAILDCATREFVGWELCIGAPNATAIAKAFRMAAESFGLPAELIRDNGKDYRSMDVDMVLELLDVKATNAIAFSPQSKPIESAFTVFGNEFEPKLKGYCGRDAKAKPERLAGDLKAGDLLAVDQYCRELSAFMAYHNTERHHGGLKGKTPAQVRQSWRERGWVPRTCDQETIAQITRCRTPERTVRRCSITVDGVVYEHADLVLLSGQKVYATYDACDIGTVTIHTRTGQKVCEAKARQKAAHGKSAKAIKAMRKAQKQARERVKRHVQDVLEATDIDALGEAIAATRKPSNPGAKVGDAGKKIVRIRKPPEAAKEVETKREPPVETQVHRPKGRAAHPALSAWQKIVEAEGRPWAAAQGGG